LDKGIIVEGAEAWAIVTEFTESESLCRHMLAVEAAIGAYVAQMGGDPDEWSLHALFKVD
jgi:predicted hydrolase (HD superfamily)